jgi:nucleotide-binding universal stress UspA family protein
MFEKILVAYDGSDAANKAFDLALDLAGKYGSEIKVLAVARSPDFGSEVETEAVLENSRKHYQHVLKPIKGRLAGSGLKHAVEVGSGHPAEHIVMVAEQWGAQLIVLGHRGKGLMGRWLVGSVAKLVMHHAPCAVLVAR